MVPIPKVMRSLVFALLGWSAAWGQYSGGSGWWVTHDSTLVGVLTPLEAARTALDNNIAVHRSIESTTWNTAVGAETYSWMRNYAAFVRLMRSMQRVRDGIIMMRIPVWTMLPQISFVAPVQLKDENGNSFTQDKEVASLSVVPPAYQAHWMISDYLQDDENDGALDIKATGRSLVKLIYPHKLSDVQLTFSPSPFVSDYVSDESQAIDDIKAHFFEALMDSASRLAGYGVSLNPQVLADGNTFVEGRMTPWNLKLQATVMEVQAMSTINKLRTLYIDHGTGFDVTNRLLKREVDYWDGFGEKMRGMGNARATFCMNLMNEVHMSLGRLEAYQRRMKVAETDEALHNIGKKKNPDGTYSGFLENSSNFWDMVDNLAGIPNGGKATLLQAQGLSARYSRFQFDELRGLRDMLMASERMNIALEGVERQAKSRKEIEALNSADAVYEINTALQSKRTDVANYLNSIGWGYLMDLGK